MGGKGSGKPAGYGAMHGKPAKNTENKKKKEQTCKYDIPPVKRWYFFSKKGLF